MYRVQLSRAEKSVVGTMAPTEVKNSHMPTLATRLPNCYLQAPWASSSLASGRATRTSPRFFAAKPVQVFGLIFTSLSLSLRDVPGCQKGCIKQQLRDALLHGDSHLSAQGSVSRGLGPKVSLLRACKASTAIAAQLKPERNHSAALQPLQGRCKASASSVRAGSREPGLWQRHGTRRLPGAI